MADPLSSHNATPNASSTSASTLHEPHSRIPDLGKDLIADVRSIRSDVILNQAQDADPLQEETLGVPKEKKIFSLIDFAVVLVSLICLLAASLTLSTRTVLPTLLGRTKQTQVLGFLLSIMNQCFRVVAPKFFLLIEARYGKSILQNFDAILRNTMLRSHTSFPWRANLAFFIALPISLSLVYKDKFFTHGLGTIPLAHNPTNITKPYYGMAAPPGVQTTFTPVGMSYMANATATWFSATSGSNDFTPLSFPVSYGINTLILSNSSAAMLDTPMPEYITALQRNLGKEDSSDSYIITADVSGTVTSYNHSVETHRSDPAFWRPFEADGAKVISQTSSNNQSISLLVNSDNFSNASWCFAGFVPNSHSRTLEQKFRLNALGFNTRRERCHGQWLLSRNRMQLINGNCCNGDCSLHSLGPSAQSLFSNNNFEFDNFYLGFLNEYLSRFSRANQTDQWLPPTPSSEWSPWLVPSFATVLASMYWSRTIARWGYSTWRNLDISDQEDLTFDKSEIYYPVVDHLQYQTPILSHTWLLFLILAIQPVLTLLVFLLGFINYVTPIDSGFGMVSVLAGVQPSSLALLKGASISGELQKPLPMNLILVRKDGIRERGASHEVEYILGREGGHKWNDRLEHPLLPFWLRIKKIFHRKGVSLDDTSKTAIGLNDWRGTTTTYERLA
ncbi:hypothetical protein MMC21_008512 [Puttea exsequens]|nr:hypothetical protein [Puttea exsequens]